MRNLSVFIRLLYQFNQRIEWQKVNNLIKNDISCRIADATRLYPRPKGRGFTFDVIKSFITIACFLHFVYVFKSSSYTTR